MIKIPVQLNNSCPNCKAYMGEYFKACGEPAQEDAKAYKKNQMLTGQFTAMSEVKERSLLQLNLYWACCYFVAEQVSDQNNIYSKDDIDFQVKTTVAKDHPYLIKRFVSIKGIIYLEPISIAFPNMKHLTANKYFDHAYKAMEDLTGLDRDQIITEAKARMKH